MEIITLTVSIALIALSAGFFCGIWHSRRLVAKAEALAESAETRGYDRGFTDKEILIKNHFDLHKKRKGAKGRK